VKIELDRIMPSIYVFSGHKWLCGPMGTGGIWVDRALIGNYRSDGKWSNWLAEHGRSNGGQFESGTVNLPILAGLLRALTDAVAEFYERHELLVKTRDKIERRLFGLPHIMASRRGAGSYTEIPANSCLPAGADWI
jgi:selenocysteine lyase/cysteine desulfurase